MFAASQLIRRENARARELEDAAIAYSRRRSSTSWADGTTSQHAPHAALRPCRPVLGDTDFVDAGLLLAFRFEPVGYIIYLRKRRSAILCHVESYKPRVKVHGVFLQRDLYRLRKLQCMPAEQLLSAVDARRIASALPASPPCCMVDLFSVQHFRRWRYVHSLLNCGLPQGGFCVFCNAPLGFGAQNEIECWRCGGHPERAAFIKARDCISALSRMDSECGPAGEELKGGLLGGDRHNVRGDEVVEDYDDDAEYDDEGLRELSVLLRDAAPAVPTTTETCRDACVAEGDHGAQMAVRTPLTSHTCVGSHSDMRLAFAEALSSGAYDSRSALTQSGHPLLVTSYNRLDKSMSWLLGSGSMDGFRRCVQAVTSSLQNADPDTEVGDAWQQPFGCLARCLHVLQERAINHVEGAREHHPLSFEILLHAHCSQLTPIILVAWIRTQVCLPTCGLTTTWTCTMWGSLHVKATAGPAM